MHRHPHSLAVLVFASNRIEAAIDDLRLPDVLLLDVLNLPRIQVGVLTDGNTCQGMGDSMK